jgi:HEPN domain
MKGLKNQWKAVPDLKSELNPEAEERAGNEIFAWVSSDFVEPEVKRRQECGEWPPESLLYRFQVQFLEDGNLRVLLNDEVQGFLEVKATGTIEKGQVVTGDDFSEISDYRPLDEHAHLPHVTGFRHGGTWFLAFQLAQRHPRRREALEAGREFLATAHEAHAAGRIRVCLDSMYSAVELLAKAELLSSTPAIDFISKSRSHSGLSSAYNVWGHLGNTNPKFVDAFNELAQLRSPARYLEGDLPPHMDEVKKLLDTLSDMESHVGHLVEAPLHDLPEKYNVFAAQPIRAGELVGPDASTLFPAGRKRSGS